MLPRDAGPETGIRFGLLGMLLAFHQTFASDLIWGAQLEGFKPERGQEKRVMAAFGSCWIRTSDSLIKSQVLCH